MSGLLLNAQTEDSLYQIAFRAYQDEGYSAAGQIFENLAQKGEQVSPELLTNAAIAYAKVDSLGLSMWAIQSGLRLAPNDETMLAVEAHLESRLEGMVTFESSSEKHRVEWLVWVVAIGVLIQCALLFFLPWRSNPKVQRGLAIASLPLILFLVVHFFWWRSVDSVRGVVIHSGQKLLDLPEGAANFEVSAGQVAVRLEEDREWVKVVLPDGVGGWIKKAHFRMIE